MSTKSQRAWIAQIASMARTSVFSDRETLVRFKAVIDELESVYAVKKDQSIAVMILRISEQLAQMIRNTPLGKSVSLMSLSRDLFLLQRALEGAWELGSERDAEEGDGEFHKLGQSEMMSLRESLAYAGSDRTTEITTPEPTQYRVNDAVEREVPQEIGDRPNLDSLTAIASAVALSRMTSLDDGESRWRSRPPEPAGHSDEEPASVLVHVSVHKEREEGTPDQGEGDHEVLSAGGFEEFSKESVQKIVDSIRKLNPAPKTFGNLLKRFFYFFFEKEKKNG